MAVKIDSISFTNEFRAETTDWLLGNVAERLVATIDISISEVAIPNDADSEFEFFPSTGYVTPAQIIKAPTSEFANFQVGDIINISGTTSNNVTGKVILEKFGDDAIRVNHTFTNEVTASAIISYATPITGVNFFYGLIENDEAFNTLSKISGTNQKYYAGDLDATDLVTVTTMTAEGSKAWQNGGATIKGLGTTTYEQKFRITHTFDVLPYYTEEEKENFLNNIRLSYFQDTKCLKYVSRIEALEDITNPNQKQIGEFSETLGNTGEFSENFNNVPTVYTATQATYTNNASQALNTLESTTDEQNVTFKIRSSTNSFSNTNTKILLWFSLTPTKSDYTNSTRTVKQNFLFDRKLLTLGSSAVNGDNFGTDQQVIYQAQAVFVSSGEVTINFKVKFLENGVNYINGLEERGFIIGVITQNHTLATAISDKSNIIADKGAIEINYSDDGLITYSSPTLIEHDDNLLVGSIPFVFSGDEVIARRIFTLDTVGRDIQNITIKSIKGSVVARKDDANEFTLVSNEVDVSSAIKQNYIQQINISNKIIEPVFSNTNRSNFIIKRRSDLDVSASTGLTNLISNGSFDNNILGWDEQLVGNGNWTWSNGVARCIGGSGSHSTSQMTKIIGGMVVGEDYRLTYTVKSLVTTGSFFRTIFFAGNIISINSVGTFTFDVLNWDGVDNALWVIFGGSSSASIEVDDFILNDLNEVASTEVTEYAYEVSHPFVFNWAYWEQLLGVNNDFFNPLLPQNGNNNFWYHYQTADYSIVHRLEVEVENNGFTQVYKNDIAIDANDYSSNALWTTKTIKSYNPSNIELTSGGNKFLDSSQNTRIEAIFEKSVAFISADISVVIWAEVFEVGGIGGRGGISSDYDVTTDSWFESVDTSNRVKLTFTGNQVKAEALINKSKLPTASKFTVYARLYESTAGGEGLQQENLDFILQENDDNILLEA